MKKIGGKIAVVLAVIALLGVYYYVALPAVNIHATEFWIFLVILVVLAALIYVRKKKLNRYEMKESKGLKAILTVLVVIVAVYLLGSLLSSPIVNAKKYQKLMKVETGEFTKDIEELSFVRFRFLTVILRRFWVTERWEVWLIWFLSLKWMSSIHRSITRIVLYVFLR